MDMKKESESVDKSIYRLGRVLSLGFISLAIVGFLILLLPLFVESYDYSTLGSLGDATGGFLNPMIAIAAALLTFLAFYVQFQANNQVVKQFEKQKVDESQNFEYTRLKERIHLIINEIDDFDIAFHEGKLISKLNEIPKSKGKKYNFKGVQGLNLFLIEYFQNKKEQANNSEYNLEDSFHAIALNIENILVLFYNCHISVEHALLYDTYKNDLLELITYLYQSKISFLAERYLNNTTEDYKLNKFLIELKKSYSNIPK